MSPYDPNIRPAAGNPLRQTNPGVRPQQGVNPLSQQQGQQKIQSLPPDQMAALRNDPQIIQAVKMLSGRDIPLEQVPDSLLLPLASLVNKSGVQEAVSFLSSRLPPEVLQQIRRPPQAQGIRRPSAVGAVRG